jgi:hypothetical protein
MRKYRYTLIALAIFLSFGCKGKKPLPGEVVGIVQSRGVVIFSKNLLRKFDDVKVYTGGRSKPVATAPIRWYVNWMDFRFEVSESVLELVNLPKGWTSVTLSSGSDSEVTAAKATQHTKLVLPAPPKRVWPLRNPFLTVLFILCAVYAVMMVGVTGGPNHGEHPFIMTILNGVVFIIFGRVWAEWAFYIYLALLAFAVYLSIRAMMLIMEARWKIFICRVAMALAWAGMLLVLSVKEYNSTAEWINPQCLQIYVEKSLRNKLELLGQRGKKISEASLDPSLNGRILYFWASASTPSIVRIIPPDGKTKELALKHLNK